MDVRRSTVTGDGVELAVWERGDPTAPTVVLVHGYPDTHLVWDGVAEDLATDHHVVAYDVRGAGESGVPATRAGYDLDHLVADLGAVIDAAAPDRAMHLVGHDWGSIQSWEAVAGGELDGRIASYTTISGPCLDHVAQWVRARRSLRSGGFRRLAAQGVRSWYIAAFQVPRLAELGWRTVVPAAFVRHLRRAEAVPAGAGPASTLALDGARGVELYRQNVPRRMRSPRTRTTDVPVQLVVPLRDRYVTPALLDDVGLHASNLRRRDLDAGHWVVSEQPGVVAELVRQHVTDVLDRRAASEAGEGAGPVE